MRSSGASEDTRRENAAVAMSISSIDGFSVSCVVRGYRDHAGTARAVAPSVARATLDNRVAGPEADFLRVENESDLACEDQAEIKGACLLRRDDAVPVGRQGDDAAKRAARRRRKLLVRAC